MLDAVRAAERCADPEPVLARPFLMQAAELDQVDLVSLTNAIRRLPGLRISEWKSCLNAVRREALAPAAQNGDGDWRSVLDRTQSGTPRPTMDNVMRALAAHPHWREALRYDEFAEEVVVAVVDPLGRPPRKWRDIDDLYLTAWFQQHGLYVNKIIARDGLTAAAAKRSYHPVREYLAGLKWDGEPRLDTFGLRYLGCDDSVYSGAVCARWLISGVARIFQPGCKADHCLVMEGAGGIGKTTALEVLGGQWYHSESASAEHTDTLRNLRGKWIVELNEAETLRRTSMARFKSFLSDAQDRYRDPFEIRPGDRQRQNIFAMTVDRPFEHEDEAGGRRFWPVVCRYIDVPGLRRDRDQIWAEAVDRYRAGSAWHITKEVLETVKREQQSRFASDVWEPVIAAWLDKRREFGRFYPTTEEILHQVIEKPKGTWTQNDKVRVGRVMRHCGYVHAKTREGYEWRRMADKYDGA